MAMDSWDASLETGNELIDRQHRELIGFVDELKSLAEESKSDILVMLERLMDFAVTHFHAEESLMAQVDYPADATVEMTKQHNEFKSYARLRVLEYRRDGRLSILPLAEFVEEFLKGHEFGLDRLLADWIRARE